MEIRPKLTQEHGDWCMSPKPYETWSLATWLYELENRYSVEVKLRLVNPKLVAERLQLLKPKATVITVAGTNGKGSTVAALEAIYCAAGYRVGSYTSPHLLEFNERIRINQRSISDASLCAAFSAIEEARADTPLTYFEMATLAALIYFSQHELDLIILEVGVGGRLDATNIIDADLAIITTIDLDHIDYLGSDKESIGYEKAGILRKNIPFIYADFEPPKTIVARSLELNNQMYCLGVDYSFQILDHKFIKLDSVTLPLAKINPKAQAAAFVASKILADLLPVSFQQLQLAMKNVTIMGRQQVIDDAVKTVYDVAHNPQAVKLLAKFIETNYHNTRVNAVFSGLSDKDLRGMIKPFSSIVNSWYLTSLDSKRAASDKDLMKALEDETGKTSVCYSSPKEAYAAAFKASREGDLILVYGSFLLVSAVMDSTREVCL